MNALTATLPIASGDDHWREGVELAARQFWTDAIRAFWRATRVSPQDRVYWLNLANAQRHRGALARAVAAARRCLRLEPGDPLALRLEADCLVNMHRYAEAAKAFARLEADGNSDAETMAMHASMLLAMHQPQAAAGVLLRALPLEPTRAGSHLLLADACRDQGRRLEAVECIKTALALDPANLFALSHLSYVKRQLMDWSDYAADLERLRADSCGASLFALLSMPLSPEFQLQVARSVARTVAAGVRPLAPVAPETRGTGKLRLGWLSYDFRDHPVAQLLEEVVAGIDRERFEVVLYSISPDDGSVWRARLKAAADRFVDLSSVSDQRAAEIVRDDGIDVLIDLMGHTRGHRMRIFAYRPAPVQAGFLGYPGSTGAGFIDYVVGDPLVTPLAFAGHFSEKLAQLPLTFQPNGRGRPLPQPMSRAEAGLPEDAFVMCAFHNGYKILPDTFDLWCEVMHEVPHAVLWLRASSHPGDENACREAERRGIPRQRLRFARADAYERYFSRLALADVFVDTWPYNAHTTASDALWAGVPVVTRYGDTLASRVAASALNAAGLGELVFDDAAGYRQAIVALAQDPARLAGYRRHLDERRMTLPLFDTPRYVREFESLVRRMFDRWRAGLPGDHLPAQT